MLRQAEFRGEAMLRVFSSQAGGQMSVGNACDNLSDANVTRGMIHIASPHSVDETVERLKAIIADRGATLFALIDHSGEARKAGIDLRPTKLLIFGNPKAGTPLMVAAPSIAIDLPLKILVWNDAEGAVWVSYNSPEYIQNRHRLPLALKEALSMVGPIAAKAAE